MIRPSIKVFLTQECFDGSEIYPYRGSLNTCWQPQQGEGVTHVAVGNFCFGDIQNMLRFCDLISWRNKPFHAEFLDIGLKFSQQVGTVDLAPSDMKRVVERAYRLAQRKHQARPNAFCFRSPNRIQYLHSKVLRYRPNNLGLVVTLDMSTAPALLSVQGFDLKTLKKYAEKAGIGPVVSVETEEVLFPSEIANLQIPLGAMISLCGE